MLKKLSKLLALYQATRHGYRHGPSSHRPWKHAKRKGHEHARYGGYGYPPHSQPYGYGPGQGPYGHDRPRGLKTMVIDAIVRKLLRHR